jgi:hypothetical protein
VHSSRISRFETLPQRVFVRDKEEIALKFYSGRNKSKTTMKELYREQKKRNKGET